MTLVGFKRMKIQPYDKDGKPKGDVIIVEGKANEGGTTEANITGLSKEPESVAASNITYYIARKGVGEVKCDFGILDLPESVGDTLSGYTVGTKSKITYAGENTEPPYCGVSMEAETLQGETVLLGFFKGVFSKDKVDIKTLDPKESYKPEADTWSFTAAASDQDNESKGNYFGKYIGSEEDAITEFYHEVLGAAAAASQG